jgi:hypothetical protein
MPQGIQMTVHLDLEADLLLVVVVVVVHIDAVRLSLNFGNQTVFVQHN